MEIKMDYLEFLETKKVRIKESGFDVLGLNPLLKDFQKHIVKIALKKGRYAIFADCGLGKTFMQLEWANKVCEYTEKPVLILAPLAVSAQTIQEGVKFGIEVKEYDNSIKVSSGIYITNYEQLDNINDISSFSGVVLDESSILKNFDGATKELIISLFSQTQYKLACTATPSPNDPMELGNHSEFLNVMSRNEMLAMYFVHDGGDTSKWRLKGHSVDTFWTFVSQWATMVSMPSDIGFSNDGYILPELNYIEKQIKTQKKDNGILFNDESINATNFNAELRLTKVERLTEVIDIVNNSKDSFIIWIKQNEEGDYLKKMIPDSIEVKGSDTPEYKKSKLLGFANGEFRVLITKQKIAQFGMNFQNCHNQVFASLDFSFEGLYQSIRRCYRFGQEHAVNVYIVTVDTMSNVIHAINKKQKQFENMQKNMQKNMNTAQLNDGGNLLDIEKIFKTENATLYNGDCVQVVQKIQSDSIGLTVFSPPFAELYTYSDSLEDMGNSKDYNEFLFAFEFLVKELYRITMSGRNVAVHCMDLPIQKGKEGYIGLRDFSNMIRQSFEKEGFIYHSRITLWKDPVTEMQRTKALGLLHKQVKKDATMSRVGLPDYVLVFRKDGVRENPVKCDIPVDIWQKYASPVWMDIDYGNTLNGREARNEKDEKHICPLQLDTINRLITLYSNQGDTVFTPFMGIGSEVYEAIKNNRKGIGIELKKSYFELACRNIISAEKSNEQKSIF